MYCYNCGQKLEEGMEFCPACGTKQSSGWESRYLKLRCISCGGSLTINSERTEVNCPYCGEKQVLIMSDIIRLEKMKNEYEESRRKEQNEREDRNYARQELDKKVNEFLHGDPIKILVCGLAMSLLGIYIAWYGGHIFATGIAVIQFALLIVSLLIGVGVIKKNYNLYILLIVVAAFLFIPYVMLHGFVF